jgi:hypothetical protein
MNNISNTCSTEYCFVIGVFLIDFKVVLVVDRVLKWLT